jgi:hypothetical protein
MILRPAGRFLTIPFPPGPLAARFLAAVIRPPLLFFAINIPFLCGLFSVCFACPYRAGIVTVDVFFILILSFCCVLISFVMSLAFNIEDTLAGMPASGHGV